MRGQVDHNGIEQISTQTLFDHLEVLQPGRGAGACRRLAGVMRELGWIPVRVRKSHQPGTRNRFAVTAATFEIDHRENARVKADAYFYNFWRTRRYYVH